MERKLLCVLLCLGTAFGAWAQDEDEPSIDGLYYNFYSEVHTATVRYCENEIDVLEIDIPESVTYKGEEYKVTEIGNSAFSRCYKLKRITIPNTVTVIGYYAFRGCTALESINIPEGMTSIGLGVFYDCAGLKSITFPSSLVRILSGAFFGCSGLTSITLPEYGQENETSIMCECGK